MAEAASSAVSAVNQNLNVPSFFRNSDGRPVFAHLFASPLVQETVTAQGTKEFKAVDELEYGEERNALLDALKQEHADAPIAVIFKSEVGLLAAQFDGQNMLSSVLSFIL